MESCGILQELLSRSELWNPVEFFRSYLAGVNWNAEECCGILWNDVESCGIPQQLLSTAVSVLLLPCPAASVALQQPLQSLMHRLLQQQGCPSSITQHRLIKISTLCPSVLSFGSWGSSGRMKAPSEGWKIGSTSARDQPSLGGQEWGWDGSRSPSGAHRATLSSTTGSEREMDTPEGPGGAEDGTDRSSMEFNSPGKTDTKLS